MNNILEQFVTLWVVIDPIGTIPVFVAVTASMTARQRRQTALQAALVASGVLLFFLVFGQLLITALGIGLNSFQVAGGIVLFIFALTMIFGESKPEHEVHHVSETEAEPHQGPAVGVFPLAVPSLASPGAMLAIVLLTDNTQYGLVSQATTAGIMLVVIAFGYLGMRLADPLIRLIGTEGAAIISRVMGMILAAVAADAVLSALLEIIRTGTL